MLMSPKNDSRATDVQVVEEVTELEHTIVQVKTLKAAMENARGLKAAGRELVWIELAEGSARLGGDPLLNALRPKPGQMKINFAGLEEIERMRVRNVREREFTDRILAKYRKAER